MAASGRLKLKQAPVDAWSIRERLSLGCSVLRSGDQNWVSVSRSIKPFGEPNRPAEWFSQKNCALQYADLLEKVQTPKRKSGGAETPGDQIVRRLTIERIEELKRIVQEEQQKYKKLKREIEAINAGQYDDRIKEYWQEIQAEKKAAEDAAAAAAQKAAEESKVQAEAAAKPSGKPVAYSNKLKKSSPNLRLKLGLPLEQDDSTSDSMPDSVSAKTEDDSSNLSAPSTSTTPQPPQAAEEKPKPTPQSPLLSSLLANRQDLSHFLQPQQQQQQLLQQQKQVQQIQQQQQRLQPEEQVPVPQNILGTPVKQEPIEVDTPSPKVSQPMMQISSEDSSAPVVSSSSLSMTSSTVPSSSMSSSLSASSGVVPKTEIPTPPAIGAPTLSRLLGTPPVTCTSSAVLGANNTSPDVSGANKTSVGQTSQSSQRESKTVTCKSGPAPSEKDSESESEKTKDQARTKEKIREESEGIKGKAEVKKDKTTPEKSKDATKVKNENLASEKVVSSEKNAKLKEPEPSACSEPDNTPETRLKSLEQETENVEEEEEVKDIDAVTVKVRESPVKKELQLDKEDSVSEEVTPTTPVKGTPSVLDEEPPSPASSIRSNETDGGSSTTTTTRGRPRGRSRGSHSRGRRSSRVSRTRHTDDKRDKDAEMGSKPSEAESSDDEATMPESDDASAPRRTLSISESVPNSPASLSQCSDTEDEKAYKVWKKSIMLVWRSAANHKYANVFLHPVTDEIAPGYRSIVYRPMDLSTIKKNIETAVIRTTAEFQRDMMLMFTNAIMYNNSDHNVYHMANEMYNDVMMHIEQYVNTQMMVNAETKILRASRRSEAASSDKEDDSKKRRISDDKDGGKAKKRKM